MPDSSVDFASLLCSRICHDLLSPVGAMNNGLELLADEDDPETRGQVLQLLADSARASADRLKFFRLAFGSGGAFGDSIATSELRSAVEGLAHTNPRITLGWMVDAPTLSKNEAKILLNLTMIVVESLVRGGTLDIGAEGAEIVVRAQGPRIVLDKEVRAVLAGESDPAGVTSRTSPAWLVRRLAEEAHGTIGVADQEDGVLILAATMG
jgi:histidine phosphotransferase ChpT